MERLWDMLLAGGVDPAADGWTVLTEASGLSLDGNSIVGTGIRNGNAEAFLVVLTVPEPGAIVLLAVGAEMILLRRVARP